MKSALLFLILLICDNSLSQTSYSITKDASVYDIAGGDFITTKLINDKTHLKHYDYEGNIIWEDSLSFQGTNGIIQFHSITHFIGTDDYVITMINDLTPDNSNFYQNDTLIYQFTKLDLSNHQFTLNVVDTFQTMRTVYTWGETMIDYNDTSIVLFLSDRTVFTGGFMNYATYSLNSSLETSLIAHSDSIKIYQGYYTKFIKDNNEILIYQRIIDWNMFRRYTEELSLFSENYFNTSTNSTFDQALYSYLWNMDSLFVFTQGTTSSSYSSKWRFDWHDLSSTSINSTTFITPLTNHPMVPITYLTNRNRIAIDKANKKIILLTFNDGDNLNEIDQKIFVYDFDFNLTCEMYVSVGSEETNLLQELNDRVYIKVKNSNESLLYLVDCSMSNINEISSEQNDIQIYPNPTFNSFKIINTDSKELFITLLSNEGKILKKFKTEFELYEIDISQFDSGIYFLNIESAGVSQTKRIVKI